MYKVKYRLAFKDPFMPPGRLHHAIFVQTKTPSCSGYVHHVIGDITSRDGMKYKKGKNPKESGSFHSMKLLGYTLSDNHPTDWKNSLGSLPTPPQQRASNL